MAWHNMFYDIFFFYVCVDSSMGVKILVSEKYKLCINLVHQPGHIILFYSYVKQIKYKCFIFNPQYESKGNWILVIEIWFFEQYVTFKQNTLKICT